MAVPKRKKSKSKSRSRRASYYKIKLPEINTCKNCGESTKAHTACPSCGYYKGRLVVTYK